MTEVVILVMKFEGQNRESAERLAHALTVDAKKLAESLEMPPVCAEATVRVFATPKP